MQRSSNKDYIVGFEDYGNGNRTRNIASNCLIFMLRGIARKWKLQLAFFFARTSCPAPQLKDLLLQCIEKVSNIGLKVTNVITDQGPNMLQMTKLLGISPDKPYFEHIGKKFFYLFDTPHLIKSTRNNIKKHSFKFGGKVAKLEHIRQLYQIDLKQNYRLVPKLTSKHVDLPGFAKQSVKLAFQSLSHTMYAGLSTLVATGKLPKVAADTADFCKEINNLCDSVNGNQIKSANKYKSAIKSDSIHIDYYKKIILWFKDLRVINHVGKDVTSQMRFISGWIVTLSSFIQLWNYLNNYCEFEFLIPRRLNQDPLENLNCILRHKGGSCDNPTPIMLGRLFRQSLSTEIIKLSKNSNCEDDKDAFLVLLGDSDDSDEAVTKSNNTQFESEDDALFLEVEQACTDFYSDNSKVTDGEGNGSNYVFGYVIRYILKIHSCTTCTTVIVSDDTTVENSKQLYVSLKAYPVKDKASSFGNLFNPTPAFYNYLMSCEQVFSDYFAVHASDVQVVENLCSSLSILQLPGVCSDFPKEKVLRLFSKIRIDYTLKFSNREFAACSKKQRKLLKITGL